MIVRLVGAFLGILLVLIGLALLCGRGEDPYQALAVYAPYLPGSAVPGDVPCRSMSEYLSGYGETCTLETVPYCQRGYLIVRQQVIAYIRLIGCEFPAAYLIAHYGRPERITHYRRIVMLVWGGMSAQLRRTGWFNTMQWVSSIGWWQPS